MDTLSQYGQQVSAVANGSSNFRHLHVAGCLPDSNATCQAPNANEDVQSLQIKPEMYEISLTGSLGPRHRFSMQVRQAGLPMPMATQNWLSYQATNAREPACPQSTQNTTAIRAGQHVSGKSARETPRDLRLGGRRPSLAATHPANYGSKTSHINKSLSLPLPPYFAKQRTQQPTPPYSALSTPLPVPEDSLPELPWLTYTDPMRQASTEPACARPYLTVLQRDTNLDHGNVISPTFMIALPFGTATEMAHYYPLEERRVANGSNGE